MMRALALCLGLWIASHAAHSASSNAALPKALLITGLGTADPNHPQHILSHRFYNDRIAAALDGIVEVTVTEDLSKLDRATLREFDLILNNSFLLEPSPQQLEAFYEFIGEGGAYMTLHAGLVSFLNSDRYSRMMGGKMAGHYPLRPFTVETFEDGFGIERTSPWAHPIARGVPVFETNDELYVVETNTDEYEVIARAESHPIVWWRPWRNGSVLAFTLGHAEESIDNPGYRALLRNCVRWLVGEPIMEPLRPKIVANDGGTVQDVVDLASRTHVRGATAVGFAIENDRTDLLTATVDEQGKLDLRLNAGRTGVATLTMSAATESGRVARSVMAVDVRERGSGNLAAYHGVTAHSSSNEPRWLTADPNLASDGDPATRWSSNYRDDAWIYLDLGTSYLVDRARLIWQGAYAAEYQLQVSDDAQAWRTVATRAGRGGTEEIRFRPTEARYVRMLGTRRATNYGYSLHEFEVYGRASGS